MRTELRRNSRGSINLKNVKIKKEDKQRLKHLCPRHSHNSHCFLLTYSSILNVDGWGGGGEGGWEVGEVQGRLPGDISLRCCASQQCPHWTQFWLQSGGRSWTGIGCRSDPGSHCWGGRSWSESSDIGKIFCYHLLVLHVAYSLMSFASVWPGSPGHRCRTSPSGSWTPWDSILWT